ncbi:MAG: hypothetical protein JKY52_04825 [Flavobacteriales bacterium]|nr:hypothetical protein [Flavobacteriales bacterium]
MFGVNKIDFYHIRLILAVAMLSSAIVSYEIQLIHFFTIVQWHHFAYMVISIALLGFGASGTVISIFRKWLLKRTDTLLPLLMICSGLFMSVAVRLSRSEMFLFDSYTLFVDRFQYLQLLLTYLLFSLPFFLGALAIGLIFVKKVSDIGTYYFSDLVGAGIGGAMAILLFWKFSPQEIPSIIAFLPILAGIIILRKKARLILISFAIGCLSLIVYHLHRPFDFSHSQFKGVSYALNLPEAKITYEKSSPYGLIQVVSSPVLRYAPGLSLTHHDAVAPGSVIFYNGDWYASIQPWSKKDTSHLLNYTTMSLPYAFGHRNSVLLLDAHGGLEISHALFNGAQQITAVEPNEIVISLLKHEYAPITDSLFYHPNLQTHVLESRTFLSQTQEKYDLIQLPLLGNFGGTVGLNALNETNLLTKEAFSEMWNNLNPNGLIAISSWMDYPHRMPLKSAATISESLESFGIAHPLNHIAMIKSWGTITFVVKRRSLTPTDINSIQSFCHQYEFDPVMLPGAVLKDKAQYHTMEDENFFYYLDGIFSSKREKIIDAYDFNIQPATDNKPYFFQFLRWKKLSGIAKQIGQASTPFLELGYLIAGVTFIQVITLALFLIILPLFRLGWKGGNKAWVLLYFCGLGFGYMFLEIVFIKHFVLYLGHPIYSAAIVISIMLISSGIGSYFSSRLRTHRKTLLKITGIVAVFILFYAFFIGPFLSSTVGLHISTKIGLTCALIALPSFFMGMPFPIGLKAVNIISTSDVPWAWGINGCVSVVSTTLAVIIAVEFGFTVVMLFSAAAYTIAFLSNFLFIEKPR